MSFVLHSFYCSACSREWEELVDRTDMTSVCEECGKSQSPCISTPGLGTFSMRDRESQMEVLKNRSFEHSRKELKKRG